MDEAEAGGQRMLVSSQETALCQRCSNPVREEDAELGMRCTIVFLFLLCHCDLDPQDVNLKEEVLAPGFREINQ